MHKLSDVSIRTYHYEQTIHRYDVMIHPTDELLHDLSSASGGGTDECRKQ
jgi:hypothetical protein